MSRQTGANDLEIRAAARTAEIDPFDGRVIRGMPIVFNSESVDLGGFREIIRPEALDRTFRDDVDVLALLDHDSARVMGRRSSGTLFLKRAPEGVEIKIDPPDTSYARDAVAVIARRDVRGMSFGFRVRTDEWRMVDGFPVRDVLDLDLVEVSIVAFPAYPATDVSVAQRSLEAFRRTYRPSLATRARQLRQGLI